MLARWPVPGAVAAQPVPDVLPDKGAAGCGLSAACAVAVRGSDCAHRFPCFLFSECLQAHHDFLKVFYTENNCVGILIFFFIDRSNKLVIDLSCWMFAISITLAVMMLIGSSIFSLFYVLGDCKNFYHCMR